MDLLTEELWKSVLLICRGFANISLRRGIDNVTNSESLNCFVLSDASPTVIASDILDMAATVLRSTVVSAFNGHLSRKLRDCY